MFSEPSTEFPFCIPDVEFAAIFARNGIEYTPYLIFWNGIFGFGKKTEISCQWSGVALGQL